METSINRVDPNTLDFAVNGDLGIELDAAWIRRLVANAHVFNGVADFAPIHINEDGTIDDGHHRAAAAVELGCDILAAPTPPADDAGMWDWD